MRIAAIIIAAAAALALPAPAVGGSLSVDPIRLEIGAGRRTATLRVRNQEQVPVTIRTYALRWTQAGGEDVYEDSAAVIVSPPIFTIPAGGTQLIRVGLRTPSSDPAAYRLMVEEVPQASPGGGVQVALRLNLPLFSAIAAGTPDELSWTAARGADGHWTVEATNSGRNYVRVEQAAAQAATGIAFDGAGGNLGVVLPGGSRRWTVGAEPVLTDRTRFAAIQRSPGRADAQLPLRRD